jgi:stalled ribosome rescue protein Dom34
VPARALAFGLIDSTISGPLHPDTVRKHQESTMTSHRNAVVWLDHHEARVFHVDLDGFDASKLEAPHRHVQRHPKGPGGPHEHPDDLHRFFGEVARALDDAERILVVGPSTAKLQFLNFIHAHHATLVPKVVGIETVDHPTDRQLIAYAKQHFDVAPLRVE